MKPSPLVLVLLLAAVLLPASLPAQGTDRKAHIPVTLTGSSTGYNYKIIVNDATSTMITLATDADQGIQRDLRLMPGVRYTIGTVVGNTATPPQGYANYTVNLKAPEGYTVFVGQNNGNPPQVQTTQITGAASALWDTDVGSNYNYSFQIVENAALGAALAGKLTRLDVGDLVFEVGLGTLKSGKSAGRLQLRSDGRIGANYGLPTGMGGVFSIYGLNLVAPYATGLAWVPISGGLRLETGQVKVEAMTGGTDQYTLSFYAGNDSGGYNGSAYATYTLEKITSGFPANAPANSDCLKITEVQGSVTIVRHVFRSTVADAWYLFEGSGGEQRIEEHISAAAGSDRQETITVRDSSLNAVAKRRLTWTPYNVTELLTQEEVWTNTASGSPGLTTTYEYYTGSGDGAGDKGKLKKVTQPHGGTVEYNYYDDTARLGRVETVTEPWSTGSSTVSKVTTYDYDGPPGALSDYLKAETTTINGTPVAKTVHVNNFSTTSTDGQPLVERTSTHFADAISTLTSVTTAYSKHADYFFAQKPYVIKQPDGRQQSFRYQKGTYSGGTFTEGSGNASRTLIVEGTQQTGGTGITYTTTVGGLTFAAIGLVANQSTLTEVIRDAEDNVVSEKTWVWDGSGLDTAKPIVSTTTTWADGVRQTGRTEVNGAQQDWTWQGAYLASAKDATGVELTYTYDSVGRLSSVTRTALGAYDGFQGFDALTTSYAYDAANRRVAETQSGGSLSRTAFTDYDDAGRPVGYTLPDGRTGSTSYSFPGGNLIQVDETLPGGATRTVQTLVDGKVKQVSGTAGVAEYYSYSVNGSGQITTRVDYGYGGSARWRQTVTDQLGRTVEVRRPGFSGQGDIVVATTYDGASGLPTKVARTGLADEYRSYDAMGRLVRSGLDLGANGSLAAGDAADRVVDYETVFQKDSSDWWVCSTETTYPSAASPTTTLVTGRTWSRLTGLGGGTLASMRMDDRFGNRTDTVTTLDRTKRRVTQTTTYPGVSTPAVTIANNGVTARMTGTDGRSVTSTYDGVLRPTTQVDSRTGTTSYAYYTAGSNATDLLYSVTDPTSTAIAVYSYDSAGRIASQRNAGNHYAYFSYDGANRLQRQWGGAVTPVEYIYNALGETTELRTFRSGTWTGSTWPGGTPDTTTFTYDGPSGLLTRRQDSAGNHVDYTYNNRGLVATREWQRTYGGNRVRTDYAYVANSTELSGKTYNDGTASAAFTYTRLGQLATAQDVSDGTSVHTRTFEYDGHMRLTTEKLPSFLGSRWLSYTYETSEVIGRPSGYTLGVSGSPAEDLTSLLGYSSATGNVSTLTATHAGVAARTFTYSYASNTSLLTGLAETGTGYSQTRAYETSRDLLTQMTTQIGATTKARSDYTYNALGQKESAKQSGQSGTAFADLGGDTFYRYAYNSRGELIQAAGYMGSNVTTLNAPLPGRFFDYGYDQAGNRQNANNTGVAGLRADYTANGLNQLATRENHYVPISGTVDAAAKVVVDGTLAGQQGNFWSGEAVLNNTSGPAYTASLAVKAAKPSPQTKQVSGLLAAFLPAALETFSYDLDGNLTADGQWDYTWDAENRLVKMETRSEAMTAGLPGKRLVFRYDSLGRRTAKEVWNYSGGSWSKTSELRFVYQGWNLVAELNTSGNRQRTYAWGLDLGGSLTAMGGIGALVQTVDHTGTVASYLPGYDGQGNVAAVMKSDGTIAAAYEYSPFGETLRREGAYAATNPFRSATKYTDDESGLVYYGTRYYSPSLGRFLNRDSISEAGGVNLYAFVGNNPVNAWDFLGMDAFLVFNGFKADGGISWVEGDGPTWYTERDRSLAIASRQWGGAPLKSTFKETEEEWEKIRADRYGSGIPEERKAGNLPNPSEEADKLKTYTWNTGRNRYDPDGEGGVLSLPRYTVYADGHGGTDLVGTLGEVFLHTDIYREGAALWRESSRYTTGDRILSRATVVFFFTVGAVDIASNFVSGGGKTAASGAAKGLGKLAAENTTTVIGRVKDLQKLGPGEKSLLDRLPNLGNPKANWQQNSGVLRQEMNRGLPIRDASPGDMGGQFLNAERNLLRDRGWTFDAQTNLWMPPKG